MAAKCTRGGETPRDQHRSCAIQPSHLNRGLGGWLTDEFDAKITSGTYREGDTRHVESYLGTGGFTLRNIAPVVY